MWLDSNHSRTQILKHMIPEYGNGSRKNATNHRPAEFQKSKHNFSHSKSWAGSGFFETNPNRLNLMCHPSLRKALRSPTPCQNAQLRVTMGSLGRFCCNVFARSIVLLLFKMMMFHDFHVSMICSVLTFESFAFDPKKKKRAFCSVVQPLITSRKLRRDRSRSPLRECSLSEGEQEVQRRKGQRFGWKQRVLSRLKLRHVT